MYVEKYTTMKYKEDYIRPQVVIVKLLLEQSLITNTVIQDTNTPPEEDAGGELNSKGFVGVWEDEL